ncbi:saccharopine dehydrogenase family protein [Roseateles oligotrophus]|uniref:Saccharopine dehydrogenase NADP-binding domain-containing protein n=1 Tax=Roseateles oligotrophus TaxID=1769250 RepID=A0ABT2YKI9_9BURK|nr:saccharopine dehydrogenase NADP-binding domain-containing protein [Roseateles oligotrophus]MCV2370580.1 saccharopine dehydrogenase NADP-binding domain-containing protein [Roseateles oligotrophus]
MKQKGREKMPLKVMVLGGYGNFGARICRALALDSNIELTVAGRDGERAADFAAGLGFAQGAAVDMHAADFAQVLRERHIELVIHTAGPFQSQDYGVARACARAGVHYIDLADGRRFVCDFSSALHADFVAADRLAISGASTVPALSSAVVDTLCEGWQRLDTLDVCIAPAQTAPRGVATLRAVLSYCGAPIQVWREGQWQSQIAWAKPRQVLFRRLKPRLGALCDIPDLELFPAHYQLRQRMEFRAALEVGLSQRAFALLAWLRSVGWLKQPARLAALLNVSAKLFDPLGSRLGGMVVRATGLDADAKPVKRAWHIAADKDHGPEIPCMAAILLAKRLAKGEHMAAGAYPCVSRHTLAEFGPEFAKWGMVTDLVEERCEGVGVP